MGRGRGRSSSAGYAEISDYICRDRFEYCGPEVGDGGVDGGDCGVVVGVLVGEV